MIKLSFSIQAIILLFFIWTGTTLTAQSHHQSNGKIVFSSKRPYEGKMQWDIYVMNADGSGLINLTKDKYVDAHPEWSNDGSKIIFSSKRKKGSFLWCKSWDIYIMNADGTRIRNLTDDYFMDSEPAWSPAGAYTYVPDDLFEENLIDLGYDNILDDYVLTDNIKNITSLVLDRGTYGEEPMTIYDFTGLQDFTALEELEFKYMEAVDNLDLSRNVNLRKLVFTCSIVGNINIKDNTALEELSILGGFDFTSCYAFWVNDLDLSGNTNLKKLALGNAIAPGSELDALLASVPSLERLVYVYGLLQAEQSVDLRSNTNLKTLHIGAEFILRDLVVDLRNGTNHKLESIDFSSQFPASACIQADDTAHVENIVNTSVASDGITVATDCYGATATSRRPSQWFFSRVGQEEYNLRLEESKEKIRQFNARKTEFARKYMR